MQQAEIDRAASLLAEARTKNRQLANFPPECIPPDEATAYLIQDALLDKLAQSGLGPSAGYKVGLVSADMRRSMGGMAKLGVDSPVYGGIVETCILPTRSTVEFARFIRPYVEGEFAVRMARTVPLDAAPLSQASIAAFVGDYFAALELVDWRLKYFDYPPPLATLMLADGSSNWGAVVGAPVKDWRSLDIPSLTGRMRVNGQDVGGGKAGDLQGHPFEVLAWLANRLIALRRTLRAGDIVLLGAVTPSYGTFERGAEVIMSWDGLGEVSVRFD